MQQALNTIKTILAEIPDMKPKIPVAQITLETRFRQDMGFDSLAMASLYYELEERYPHLQEADMRNWMQVKDCAQSILSGK